MPDYFISFQEMIFTSYESLNRKIEKLFNEVEEWNNILKEKNIPTLVDQDNQEPDNNEDPSGSNGQSNDGKIDEGQDNMENENMDGQEDKPRKYRKIQMMESRLVYLINLIIYKL
ncbi:hypothetical protein IC582_001072 [Cucumis melo]|uniref:Uncharacterized protein n=1 Tax=Cucumis melo TaxID=3656 RepID=A0A9I9E597_CUCME